ncbi:MAG: hypothetical protein QNJ97_00970 [Myxococcota bacterium]|nr:hypothetical protein [Myxococcota bacterium]
MSLVFVNTLGMTGSRTCAIIVALPSEARPFIDHFGLKKEPVLPSIDCFGNEDLLLAVSGIGKVRSAFAVGYTIAQFGQDALRYALNVGIAGAHPNSGANIGDLFLINKIVDTSSGRSFYPDMLLQTELNEKPVMTFDAPVMQPGSDMPDETLVDMEASGFFEAASRCLPPHRLACMKIVSDHCDIAGLTKQKVESLMHPHVETVNAYLQQARASFGENGTIGLEEKRWIQALVAQLRLTVSQKHMLEDWVGQYLQTTGRHLPDVSELLRTPVATKGQGKDRLEHLRSLLFQ